jgi:hypothetical protein
MITTGTHASWAERSLGSETLPGLMSPSHRSKPHEWPKVVFLTGLQKVVDAIVSYNPETWTTQVVDGKSPEAEQLKAVKDADFVMVFRAKLTDDLARAASKARLVQLLSAGYDSMNLKLLNELKIPCANNGGANSRAVADHAVLGMLALYRNLSAADKAMREGKWSAAIDGTNTFEMAGKLVGIMGIGKSARRSPAGSWRSSPGSSTTIPISRPRTASACASWARSR